jgi:hypothetical protein
MIKIVSRIIVKDIRTSKQLLVLVWQPVGKSKNGYKITRFRMFINEGEMASIESTTAAKVELLANTVHSLVGSRAMRYEHDLKMLINSFVAKNSPYITFNDLKTYSVLHIDTTDFKFLTRSLTDIGTYKRYTDKYVLKKQLEEIKRFRRSVNG